MKKLIAGIGIATFSTLLSAQQAFDGWFGQAGIGVANASSNETTNSINSSGEIANQNFNFNKSNIAGTISIGYSKSFDNLNLAISGFSNFSSTNFGSATNKFDIKRQANIKNLYGVSLEPGYYFDKKVLGYAKLGAAFATQTVSFPNDSDLSSENFGSSTGFLYGLGLKYELAKNWYAGAEIYQIIFPTKSYTENDGNMRTSYTFKTTYNYAGLLIGYKF